MFVFSLKVYRCKKEGKNEDFNSNFAAQDFLSSLFLSYMFTAFDLQQPTTEQYWSFEHAFFKISSFSHWKKKVYIWNFFQFETLNHRTLISCYGDTFFSAATKKSFILCVLNDHLIDIFTMTNQIRIMNFIIFIFIRERLR